MPGMIPIWATSKRPALLGTAGQAVAMQAGDFTGAINVYTEASVVMLLNGKLQMCSNLTRYIRVLHIYIYIYTYVYIYIYI